MSIIFIEANSTGTTSDAIRLARAQGYETVLVTMQPEFYRTLPDNPLTLCDQVIHCDTYNVPEILRALRRFAVEAIISFDDYHLVVAALCASALGLPHADVSGLVSARYKDLTRERTATTAGGLRAQLLREDRLSTADLATLSYPLIIKPVDESSGVGVRLCENAGQARAAVDAFSGHLVNAREYRPVRELLAEPYVDGDEYSCELYWEPLEGWHIAGITQKFVTAPPHFVEYGHLFPAALDPHVEQNVRRRVLGWMEAIGLRAGAAHVELRVKDDLPYLIEVNPRLPGGHITQLVQWCSGIDLVGRYLDFHLSGGVDPPAEGPGEFAAAASRFVLPEEVAPHHTADDVYRCLTELPTFQRGRVQTGDRTASLSRDNYARIGYALLAGSAGKVVQEDIDALAERLKH
jgi:cysteine synthase A